MKIIIAGLSRAGISLAELLSKENHDVMVIDSDKEKVESITDKYSVSGVAGSCMSQAVLMKAGANTADVCIALTFSDETNLCTSLMAKKCGTRYTAIKLNLSELAQEKDLLSDMFAVDYVMTPKEDTAEEIAKHIGLPGSLRADAFFSCDTTMIRIVADRENKLAGASVKDVRRLFETDMLVATVNRDGKVIIPNGNTRIEEKDEVGLIVPKDSMTAMVMKLGLIRKPVKSVLLIGGGEVALSLAKQLLAEKKKVTILDNNRERCAFLTRELPKATISCAKEIDSRVLMEEGIQSADVCVSLTSKDDINFMLSMFAWSCGVESVITRVGSPTYEGLLNRVNIDITISPVMIAVEKIMSFIRDVEIPNEAGNDIFCMYQIAGGLAEAIEFIAYDNFKMKNIPLKDEKFRIKKHVLIGMIIRDGEALIPDGNSEIRPGDHVVVVTHKSSGLNTINDIID